MTYFSHFPVRIPQEITNLTDFAPIYVRNDQIDTVLTDFPKKSVRKRLKAAEKDKCPVMHR